MQDSLEEISVSRFLALRKAGKIGIIWETGPICTYSPIGTYQHRSTAEKITLRELKAQIDYWFPSVDLEPEIIQRKFMGREYYLVRRKQK